MSATIYTIGYGGRTVDEVAELLRARGVSVLVDVRSTPSSAHWPEFNADTLAGLLRQRKMAYVHMPQVGGRQDLQDPQLRVQFGIGIERLREYSLRGVSVCLMCAERDPAKCHRSRLVGRQLADMGVQVVHIDQDNTPRSQDQVDVGASAGQQLLFGGSPAVLPPEVPQQPSGAGSDGTLLARVAETLASDGGWWTAAELVTRCGGTEGGVGARARDLRKPEFGGFAIECEKKGGSWCYRVHPDDLDRLFRFGVSRSSGKSGGSG